MATSTVSVQVVTSVSLSNSGTSGLPDEASLTFTAKERMVERIYGIAASGSLIITKSTEGYTTVAFLKVQCVTANKSLTLKFNSDTTGVTINPVETTGKAFYLGTSDFTTLEIVNNDTSNAVEVAVSIFERST